MSLINRVSAFFLAALAIALVGYSLTLYLLVRSHLYGQFDDGLQNALRILTASVEVEFDDAKWQPGEFEVDLANLQDVMWIVSNANGQMIDHVPGFSRSNPNHQLLLEFSSADHGKSATSMNLGHWRVLQKELDAPTPKPVELREPHEYAGIRITVARLPDQVEAQMRQLAVVVCILPVILWLIAATAGRWYFRHALQPLRAMAARASSMKSVDFGLRLPIGKTNDELADLGITFNKLLDQLQEAYDREHRFTGNAAHQLRTPLTVLQGQIDVALRRPRDSIEYRKTLQVLDVQVAEFRQIVETLLFLARSEQHESPPDLVPMAVDPWLMDFLSRWNHHSRYDELSVRTESNATVMASGPLLSQLMDNLVGNAFKYSEPGSPVVVQSQLDGDQVVLSVQDHGSGISEEDRKHLFEPFFRSQSARQAGIAGTGLGLAVAARIAVALGGTLECQRSSDEGSTFRLILPCMSDSPR